MPRPSCTTSTTRTMNDQEPIPYQPRVDYTDSTQGGHAGIHWQLQPEPSTEHSPASPLSPVAAEFLPSKSHAQGQYRESPPAISMTWKQLCLNYSQPSGQTHGSYLNAVGVPFDLGSLNGRRHTFPGVDATQTIHGREHNPTLPIASTCEPPISADDNHAGPGSYAHRVSTSRKGRKTVRDRKINGHAASPNYKQLAQASSDRRNDAVPVARSQETDCGDSEMPRLNIPQHGLPKINSTALHTSRNKPSGQISA